MVRLLQFAACAAVLVATLLSVRAFQRTIPGASSPAGVSGDARVKRDTLLDAKDAPPAPALAAGQWVNSDPLTLADLRGRVVVVDFWTFGCYNCRNTLPALNRLHENYAARGLAVVGVHSPEFDREKVLANLRREISSLGIRYPVVTDNEYETWRAYDVEAWPTVFILDRRGRVRYRHVGEGRYEEQERVVKTLLAEEYEGEHGGKRGADASN